MHSWCSRCTLSSTSSALCSSGESRGLLSFSTSCLHVGSIRLMVFCRSRLRNLISTVPSGSNTPPLQSQIFSCMLTHECSISCMLTNECSIGCMLTNECSISCMLTHESSISCMLTNECSISCMLTNEC